MSEYAPVGPLPLIRQIAEQCEPSVLGGYHLLLAHEILADRTAHETFWRAYRRQNQDNFRITIIVDNGAPEGEQVSNQALHEAALLVDADVVILPDVIGDADATLARTREAARLLYERRAPFATMGVAQGATWAETVDCLHELSFMHLDWLSVPKGWSERLLQPRFWLTRSAACTYRHNMHVLGFTDDLSDDILTARSHWLVKGIDSAMPLWLGQMGVTIDTMERHEYGRRPPWSSLPKDLQPETLSNISLIREWLARPLEGVGGHGQPSHEEPTLAAGISRFPAKP